MAARGRAAVVGVVGAVCLLSAAGQGWLTEGGQRARELFQFPGKGGELFGFARDESAVLQQLRS